MMVGTRNVALLAVLAALMAIPLAISMTLWRMTPVRRRPRSRPQLLHGAGACSPPRKCSRSRASPSTGWTTACRCCSSPTRRSRRSPST